MDRLLPPQLQRKKYIKLVGLGLGTLAVLLLLYALVHRSVISTGIKRSDIMTAKVTLGDLEGSFTVDGIVTPLSVYQVESSINGKIEQIMRRVGDRVQAGDPLISMSNDDLQLSLIDQEASVTDQINNLNNARILANQYRIDNKREIAAAFNALAKAERTYNQFRDLLPKRFCSQQDYDEAKEDYDYAKLNYASLCEKARTDSVFREQQIEQQQQAVERIKLSLEQVRSRISALNVKAPISGVITEMELNPGQMIVSGSKIAVIEDSTQYYIQANVDQYYLPRLREGGPARYTDALGDHWFKIIKIHPKLTGDKAVIDVGGAMPVAFKSGQTVNLDIVSSTIPNVLKLQIGPCLTDTGGQWVFVITGDGQRAERRNVVLGARNPAEVEVKSGLQAGEEVIISSYQSWLNSTYLRIN